MVQRSVSPLISLRACEFWLAGVPELCTLSPCTHSPCAHVPCTPSPFCPSPCERSRASAFPLFQHFTPQFRFGSGSPGSSRKAAKREGRAEFPLLLGETGRDGQGDSFLATSLPLPATCQNTRRAHKAWDFWRRMGCRCLHCTCPANVLPGNC